MALALGRDGKVAVHPVVILGNSRRRPEEISEFIDLYPDKGDQCDGEIKPYEKDFDEHVAFRPGLASVVFRHLLAKD